MYSTKFELNEPVFTKLVNHLFDSIISVNEKGLILFASETIKKTLGISPASLIEKDFFELVDKRDILAAKTLLRLVLKSDEKVHSSVLGLKNAKGDTIYCEVTLKNLLAEEKIEGILVYCRELTIKRKIVEPAMKSESTTDIFSEVEAEKVRSIIERDLPKAIERNEFRLYYQPKVNLETRKIVGAEALIRWEHMELGLISPDDFIPLAEETGEIISIGKWVLSEASKQNKKWQDEGYPPIIMSVNLSLRQFSDKSLVETVSKTLEEVGLPPHYLELEITESMTANIPKTICTLNQLKALGVFISIDDFGTGYSTLNHLKEFPIDILKIDKSFVFDLSRNPKDQAIVKTIIGLAHNLNLKVVAEGIETEEDLCFLRKHKCGEGQGYLFSRPLAIDQFIHLMHKNC